MEKKDTWKVLVLALVAGLIGGLIGAAFSAQVFIKGEEGPEGPQGLEGEQGLQGEQGQEGLQGQPGVDGTDAVMQAIQRTNDTSIDVDGYAFLEWFNLSDSDSSMKILINVSQDSRILARFSAIHQLEPPATISARIVVDGSHNSTTYVCSLGPPASGTYTVTGYVEFLTNPLESGEHTVNVQFMRESGSPIIIDRTLTVLEIPSN